ncbi:metabotropic glutamate receptor 3-like [Hydractinia symbiolongicarpus]|uniref:metabotropic glutamate receptor 3-like n=1 Tax=Hydractinia symbiolongicarpus TaxID=13093 RepID=UPI002550DC0F|nr:metabotropic glutamate receptor 3-like [Hydractinia symbiolongicarpus]
MLVVWLLVATFSSAYCKPQYLQGNGTFYIDVFLPMFDENYDINYSKGIMSLAAVRFGIFVVNKRYERYMNGYRVALRKIFTVTADKQQLIEDLKDSRFEAAFVVAVLTPNTAVAVSAFASLVDLPILTHDVSSYMFDSASTGCSKMLRTMTPSYKYRTAFLLELMKDLDWTYASMISSDGYDGNFDAYSFSRQLKKNHIFLTSFVELKMQADQTEVEEKLIKLSTIYNLNLILLFTNDEDSRKVLVALRNLKMEKKFTLVFVNGNLNYVEVIKGLEDVAVGSISLNYEPTIYPEFESIMLLMNTSWVPVKEFHLFWEQLFHCKLNSTILENVTAPYRKKYNQSCNPHMKLSPGKGYFPNSPAQTIIHGVVAGGLAGALTVMKVCHKCVPCNSSDPACNYTESIKDCLHPPNATHCPFEAIETKKRYRRLLSESLCEITINSYFAKFSNLRNKHRLEFVARNFQRTKNNVYENKNVGHWAIHLPDRDSELHPDETMQFAHKIVYDLRKNEIIWRTSARAVCSEECSPGHITHYRIHLKSCWACVKCPKNNVVLNNTCVECKFGEVSNHTTASCVALPIRYLEIDVDRYPMVMVIVCLCIVGLLGVVLVVTLFMKFNQNHIVRASGRDLSYSILFGIILMLCCPLVILTKPDSVICGARDVLPSLSCLLCYAALSMKVGRIYRIFISAKSQIQRPRFITTSSQLVILLIFVTMQLATSTAWFINDVPAAINVVSKDDTFVSCHCQGADNLAKFFINFLPSVVSIAFCTVLAFKTRNFPKNYNEAKYIGITLYVTCCCWLAFTILLIMSGDDVFSLEYRLSLFCLCNGYITLLGLFGQKLWILFRRKTLEDHHDSLKSRARSFSSPSHKDIPVPT